MTIKVALLQSQQQVIAELKEIVSEDKPVAYLFTRPHLVEFNKFSMSEIESNQTSIEVSLSPWILASADKEIPIPINQVIALVEPLESIKKMYLEKTNGSSNQTDSSNDGTESDKPD
tara:strand:- start:111 stop:461 length:351 start_codon:yes stop_codon:yes gene_type:complete